MTVGIDSSERRKRLAIAINTVAPYRLPIYSELARHFDLLVLHGGRESNRTWKLDIPEHLAVREVLTFQIPVRRRTGVNGVVSKSYFHLNVGLLWTLPSFRPDIVISNELGVRTMLCMLYAWVARVPLWVWWGGTKHSERNISGLKKWLRLALSKRIHRWISYGASSTEYLESIEVPRENILQIQNCVPHERFLVDPPGSPLWFRDDLHPVLLTVGQLIARKGLDKLIEACGRAVARGHAFTLVIVGQGPERQALVELAERVKFPYLTILSNQSQDKLNEIYKSSQAFVFPTMEDVWGLVANEALWANLPLLCSKYAGCAGEIVTGGNVFDPLSAEDFDAVLERAISGKINPADRSLLLTWQEVSSIIERSLTTGKPVR